MDMKRAHHTDKWYKKPKAVIWLLILFWPVGMYLMWRYMTWPKYVKALVCVIIAVGSITSVIIMNAILPPAINVTGDDNGHISTTDSSYKLSGYIGGGNVTFSVNGKQLSLDTNGNFSTQLSLQPGDNHEHLVAKENGKETDEDLVITLSKPQALPSPSPSTKASPKASPSTSPKTVDVNAVKASLNKEESYAQALYNQGLAVLGTYQYPDAQSGINALNDPNSPASKWSTYNQAFDSADATASTNAQKANNDAQNAYFNAGIDHPSVLDDIDNLDTQTMSDISSWKEDATSWQVSGISTSQLNSDEQKVQQDFAQAQADINKL